MGAGNSRPPGSIRTSARADAWARNSFPVRTSCGRWRGPRLGGGPRKIAVQPASTATGSSPTPTRAAPATTAKGKSVTLGGVTYADHGTKDVRTRSKLELEADDYYFSPTFLRGKPGQKLGVTVESEAGSLRNITIPALGIDKDIPPKGKVQLDLTFPASGVLAFSCKFHGPLGMNGQLLAGAAMPGAAR